jgi:hypothetical protein
MNAEARLGSRRLEFGEEARLLDAAENADQ